MIVSTKQGIGIELAVEHQGWHMIIVGYYQELPQ